MEANCAVCHIKGDSLIHILMLPEKIPSEMDYIESIYKTTRSKIKEVF